MFVGNDKNLDFFLFLKKTHLQFFLYTKKNQFIRKTGGLYGK